MKTYILFSILTAAFPCFAGTTFLQGTDNGLSHIDPINGTARINFRTDVANEHLKARFNCPAQPNLVEFKVMQGEKVVNRRQSATGITCDNIRKREGAANIVHCQEKKALEINLVEECGGQACPRLPQQRTGFRDFQLGTNPNASEAAKRVHQAVKDCSPDDENVVFRDQPDAQGKSRGVSTSLKDRSQCSDMEKRRIVMPGSPWDRLVAGEGWNEQQRQEMHDQFHLFATEPGFSVGNHTQYTYDFKAGQWCYQFFPKMKTAPVCDKGFENRTFPMMFVFPKENNARKTFGAVKMTKDENGNPVAYVGTPKAESNPVTLDESKPVMKITLSNGEKGRSTMFQALKKMNGEVISSVQVSPTMSFGRQIATQPCHRSSCLRAISAVTGENPRNICPSKPYDNPLELSANSKDLCYSCNGVSAGTCDDQKRILDAKEYTARSQAMQSCKPEAVDPQQSEGEIPSVSQ